MSAPKIKLDAYEMMVMLGDFEPRISPAAHAVLDRWMEKIPSDGLSPGVHWLRATVVNEPEAFDMTNRDDRAMVKLTPVAFNEDGSRVKDFWEKVEIPDSLFRTEFKNGKAYIEYTARDEAGGSLHKAGFVADLKESPDEEDAEGRPN